MSGRVQMFSFLVSGSIPLPDFTMVDTLCVSRLDEFQTGKACLNFIMFDFA